MAVTVGTYVPDGVELRVAMVRVEDPDPATVLGLKVPVAPAGRPVTLRFTVPEDPPKGVILTL